MRRSLLAAGLCLGVVAPSFAEPAQTMAPATMHKLPSVRARVVQLIPANAEIDVSSCTAGWCYASWRNLFGYIPADAIVAGAAPLAAAPPPVVAAPAWGWDGPYFGVGWGYGWRRW